MGKNYENKYVCDGTNATCSNIKHIDGDNVDDKSYYYWSTDEKYKYSSSVSYSGGTYTLTGDIKEIWDIPNSTELEKLSTHHYTCFTTGTTCSTINYVFNHTESGDLYYVPLSGVASISAALSAWSAGISLYVTFVAGLTIPKSIPAWMAW